MRKILLLSILITTLNCFAQKYQDSLTAVTGQEFYAPKIGALVIQNVTNIGNITVSLYNKETDSFIKKLNQPIQKPSLIQLRKLVRKKEGRGQTVWFVFKNIINDPGEYYIKTIFKVKNEKGKWKTLSVKYYVNIVYPTLAVPFNIDESYSTKENFSFSFATNEFTDPTKYSYILKDEGGEINITGHSAFVKLDTILQQDENYGKTITITGMYNGKPFYYKDNNNNLKQTEWKFDIIHPSLGLQTDWLNPEKDYDTSNVLNLQNKLVTTFSFIYSHNSNNGIIALSPEIRNVRIKSSPAKFLKNSTNYRLKKGLIFTDLIIQTNENFWKEIDNDIPIQVDLTITLDTQFERNKIFKLRANIINIKLNE